MRPEVKQLPALRILGKAARLLQGLEIQEVLSTELCDVGLDLRGLQWRNKWQHHPRLEPAYRLVPKEKFHVVLSTVRTMVTGG